MVSRFAGALFSKFKEELAECLIAALTPIAAEMTKLETDPGYIDGVLKDGAARANAIAAPVLKDVYDIVGFVRG